MWQNAPVQNPCGGRRWETHDDFTIEVEGEGFPTYESGPHWQLLNQTWDNWAPEIRSAAKKNGIPPSWVLAFATMETGAWSDDPERQRTIRSPVGAIGIMQVMPFVAHSYGYSDADMEQPATNINLGAQIMREHADRNDTNWQLPIIAAKYNAGPARLCDTTGKFGNEWNLYAAHNYPGKVIRYNNTAIEVLGTNGAKVSTAAQVALGASLAFTGVVAAIAIAKPSLLRKLTQRL
jgi:hypothetical protein